MPLLLLVFGRRNDERDMETGVFDRLQHAPNGCHRLSRCEVEVMHSPSIPLEADSTYLPEVWTYYVLGVVLIGLRYAVRVRLVGWRGFTGDDYVTVLTLVLYTANAVIVQITYHTGSNLDVRSKASADELSQQDIDILTLGSKLEFASWYTYPGFLWCLKFTAVFFYRRLTFGFRRRKTLAALFWICGLSYLALCLNISLSCRPYSRNWQIRPLPPLECAFRPQNFVVLVVLNVLTDGAIMVIPVPLLYRLRVPIFRKIGVSLLLGSGAFIIISAVLRAVLTIGGTPSVININRWGFRESIIGLLTVTAPVLCPLFTREFWRKGRYRSYNQRSERWSGDGGRPDQPDFGNWLRMVELRSALGEELNDNDKGSMRTGQTSGTIQTDGTRSTMGMRRTGELTASEMYGRELYHLERSIRAGGNDSTKMEMSGRNEEDPG